MNRRLVFSAAVGVLVVFGGGYILRARADGVPSKEALSYYGVIEDAKGPVNGPRNVQVLFYDAATNGTQVCQSASTPVNVVNGRFNVLLPETCTTGTTKNPNLWINVLVDGSDTGRAKIGAVPYAMEANHATTVSLTAEPLKSALAGKADVSPVPNWTNYTPALTPQTGAVASTLRYGRYRVINDTLEVRAGFTLNGTWSTTQMIVSLPAGYSANLTKAYSGGLVGTIALLKQDGGETVMGCYAGGSGNNCFGTGSGLFNQPTSGTEVRVMMSIPVN